MSTNSAECPENTCVVCFKNVEIYSIGSCDHTVCYECSTRMRVLCRQNECPICRQDLPKVVFTCAVRAFHDIQNCSLQDRKFKIYFENGKIQDAFYKLLEHSCSVCPNAPTFRTFQNLNDHMRRAHELYYCDLCVEYLKIFTSERRCYTRTELAQHRRKGDTDDRSHRGHPLCQFCDVRYMDNDDLYRHLRREHLFCHFCDADGFDLYYSSYDYLREHFRDEHYLCEEGACLEEKFTPVFRTEIDLKAHKASAHGRAMGKAAAKLARTLELEFTLKPRPRPDANRRGKPRAYFEPGEPFEEGAVGGTLDPGAMLRSNSPTLNPNEFPSLPSNSAPVLMAQPQQRGRSGGLTIHAVGHRNTPLAVTDENFPVLGLYNDASSQGTSVRLNINQDRGSASSSRGTLVTPRNVSIHVNHRANGEQKIRIRQDDFPALTSDKKTQHLPAAAKWVAVSSKKPTTAPPAPTPKPPTNLDGDFPSLTSKFNTNLNFKSSEPMKPNYVNVRSSKENKTEEKKTKKASSVMIPVGNQYADAPEPSTSSSSSSSKSKTRKKKAKGNSNEEKSDNVKKKHESNFNTELGVVNTKDNESALIETSSNESRLVKPLPTVEDWFGGCTKPSNKSQRVSEEEEDGYSWFDGGPSSKEGILKFSLDQQPYRGAPLSLRLPGGHDLYSRKPETKAPPGFGFVNGHCNNNNHNNNNNTNNNNNNNNVKKPPPGFSIDLPRSNGLTFTNSSGQSYAISAKFDYTQPTNFEKRNQDLVKKVNQILLNDVNLEEFRRMSALFRQDQLTAEDYYEHCVKTMGETGFQEVFPELLVLLPDISKQQELYQVYTRSSKLKRGKKRLESCETCRQVVCNSEYKQHIAQHSLQQN